MLGVCTEAPKHVKKKEDSPVLKWGMVEKGVSWGQRLVCLEDSEPKALVLSVVKYKRWAVENRQWILHLY